MGPLGRQIGEYRQPQWKPPQPSQSAVRRKQFHCRIRISSLISEFPPTPIYCIRYNRHHSHIILPSYTTQTFKTLPYLPHHPSPARPPAKRTGGQRNETSDRPSRSSHQKRNRKPVQNETKNLNYLIFLDSCIAGLCEQQHLRGYLTLPTYSSLGYLGRYLTLPYLLG